MGLAALLALTMPGARSLGPVALATHGSYALPPPSIIVAAPPMHIFLRVSILLEPSRLGMVMGRRTSHRAIVIMVQVAGRSAPYTADRGKGHQGCLAHTMLSCDSRGKEITEKPKGAESR